MWKDWLRLLLLGLRVGVVPDDDPNAGNGGTEDDPDNEDDPDTEDDPDDPDAEDPDEGARGDSREANFKALRKARAEAETKRAEAETRLAELERQNRELLSRVGGGRPQNDEPTLPADADETQKFVFEGNKAIRGVSARVAKAEMMAWNAADKVEFYARAQANPTMMKYADRVEKELERMIKTEGNPAPRSAIYRYIRGQEAEEAELKAAGKPSKAAADAKKRVAAARGTGGSVRSDAGGKERMDEREARRKRLEKEIL